jgi:hypothetical protein
VSGRRFNRFSRSDANAALRVAREWRDWSEHEHTSRRREPRRRPAGRAVAASTPIPVVTTVRFACRRCGRIDTIPAAQAGAAVRCCGAWAFGVPGEIGADA